MTWITGQIDATLWPWIVALAVVLCMLMILVLLARALRRPSARERPADVLGLMPTHDVAGAADQQPGQSAFQRNSASAGGVAARRRKQPRQPCVIESAIAKAKRAGKERDVAALYLELAQSEIDLGSSDSASEHLRKSVVIASQNDLKLVHAAARLELGDLAHQDGDLTTACEHWQMARGLFHDLEQGEELASTEARMQRNGCPTDWVLTDF